MTGELLVSIATGGTWHKAEGEGLQRFMIFHSLFDFGCQVLNPDCFPHKLGYVEEGKQDPFYHRLRHLR